MRNRVAVQNSSPIFSGFLAEKSENRAYLWLKIWRRGWDSNPCGPEGPQAVLIKVFIYSRPAP